MPGSPQWSRVEELYHAALECDPSERAAFLHEACGNDDGLRREVDTLLAEAQVDAFLSRPALEVAARDLKGDLLIGRQIGAYQILSLLGAGGMGEVYRARDTSLDRDVAIKVLPSAVASDPDRVTRFAREARLLAALNHPHIAAIHGLEQADGISALVLELVDGDTLANRVARGPIPVAEAIAIATQIADGLGAAHDQGIVHRDLKPANIKLRPDGHVKILDFGLAKALAPAGADASGAKHPSSLTHVGVITGTPAYMSPEQAQGRAVDKRADVWAFGCVFYEMVTGRPAFDGQTITDTMAAVVTDDPDWDALPPALPPGVRRFLQRCLSKGVKQRISDIHDVRLALEGAFEVGPPLMPRAQRPLLRTAGILGAAAVLILSAGLVVRNRSGAAAAAVAPVARFSVALPPNQLFAITGIAPALGISPDGSHIAYAAGGALWLRPLDALDARVVPGTPNSNAHTPFFSPDSRWIGFYDESTRQLKRVAVAGGPPMVIAAMDRPAGVTWPDDDLILYGRGAKGIWQVAVASGTSEPAIAVGDGEEAHSPQLLPGGKVLFTVKPRGATSWNEADVVVQTRGATTRQLVVRGGRDARYLTTGHIAYGSADDLLVAPFDVNAGRIAGEQVSILQGVAGSFDAYTDAIQFAISGNGTLVYLPRAADREGSLVWVSRDGREQPINVTYPYGGVRVSPDGTRLVLAGGGDLLVSDASRPSWTPIVTEGQNWFPIWSPDGTEIVYNSIRDGAYRITQIRPDGTSRVDLITVKASQLPGQLLAPGAWTRDGRGILLTLGSPAQPKLGLLDRDRAAREDHQWTSIDRPYDMSGSSLSPRDDLIAYQSQYSGDYRVYLDRFPDLGNPRLVSTTASGGKPVFSADGTELFYQRIDGAMMSVKIGAGPTFDIGEPVMLFESKGYGNGPRRGAGGGRGWDVAPDGRFLMIKEASSPAGSNGIVVVQGWFEELRARMTN